jgi:hypothetical protein
MRAFFYWNCPPVLFVLTDVYCPPSPHYTFTFAPDLFVLAPVFCPPAPLKGGKFGHIYKIKIKKSRINRTLGREWGADLQRRRGNGELIPEISESLLPFFINRSIQPYISIKRGIKRLIRSMRK